MCCAQRLCSCADCARVQTAIAVAQAAIARQARKADLFSLVMKDPWAFNSFSAYNCRVEDPTFGLSLVLPNRAPLRGSPADGAAGRARGRAEDDGTDPSARA